VFGNLAGSEDRLSRLSVSLAPTAKCAEAHDVRVIEADMCLRARLSGKAFLASARRQLALTRPNEY
jgi:hypothetical protein